MRGFIISVRPQGSLNKLVFTPHTRNTAGDDLGEAVKYFNKWLFELPNSSQECLKHFHEIYKSLPESLPYFYGVEKHFDQNGNLIRQYCYPIGVGEDEVDALSTYYLDKRFEPSKDFVFNEDGHFIKAYMENSEMIFQPIEGFYAQKKRNAHIKSREKLQRLTLSLPIDGSPIPNTLKYSNYWTSIATKYATDLSKLGIKEKINKLNQAFQKSEKEFYDSVKLYREYKQRQINEMRRASTISMILQGASIIADINAQQSQTMEMNQALNYQKSLQDETKKALGNLQKKYEELNTKLKIMRLEYKNHNIPLNNDPEINQNWRLLY